MLLYALENALSARKSSFNKSRGESHERFHILKGRNKRECHNFTVNARAVMAQLAYQIELGLLSNSPVNAHPIGQLASEDLLQIWF